MVRVKVTGAECQSSPGAALHHQHLGLLLRATVSLGWLAVITGHWSQTAVILI